MTRTPAPPVARDGLPSVLGATWPLLVIAAAAMYFHPAVALQVDPPGSDLVGWVTLGLCGVLAFVAGWHIVRRRCATLRMAAVAGALVSITAFLAFPTVYWIVLVLGGRAAAGGLASVVVGGLVTAGIVALPCIVCACLGGWLVSRFGRGSGAHPAGRV